jgi:TolB protein
MRVRCLPHLAALVLFALAAVISLVLIPGNSRRPPVVRKEREARIRIAPRAGLLPRLAVDPIAASAGDAELGVVIWDVLRSDLEFEEAFELLTTWDGDGAAMPADADGRLSGALRRENGRFHLELRLRDARSGQMAFGREFVGPEGRPRLIAHVAANELLRDQAGIQGLAHSRLAFVSDRLGSFREPTGSMRRLKEIFVADYDGANEQRVTVDGDLDMTPAWSPDGRALAYTSFRRGYQDIFLTRLEERRQEAPAGERGQNRLPAWSPDGTRFAFSSNRDGNEEIYVMNADGSGARRLTTHWGIDTAPAWSPRGTQIAFTSDRTGSPQIWVMDADGANLRQLTTERYCDRPSWSQGPIDEIAYVSRTKTGYDIKVIEPATGNVRQLTFGPQNESPAFSPNGRHIAFTSTRSGTQQIWTMTRTGSRLRQVTRHGNNSMAAWSR